MWEVFGWTVYGTATATAIAIAIAAELKVDCICGVNKGLDTLLVTM